MIWTMHDIGCQWTLRFLWEWWLLSCLHYWWFFPVRGSWVICNVLLGQLGFLGFFLISLDLISECERSIIVWDIIQPQERKPLGYHVLSCSGLLLLLLLMLEVSPVDVKPGCDESSLKAAEIRRDLIILVVLSIGWEKILDPIPHYCIAHFKSR